MLCSRKDPESHIPGRCTITIIIICFSDDDTQSHPQEILSRIQTQKIARKDQTLNEYRRHQTVCQKGKRIGNPYTDSKNIQSRYRNGIWHRKMHHASNGKREMTHDGRNRTTKSRQNQNIR